VIEFLKNDESPKSKFIIKKMVMFPNENIEEYKEIMPFEIPNFA
jgi:hypothetical protein